ncbi:MAG: DUF885 family protein [Erysipelotrichia bacterium]|nr:DUF885 family protein [Erysipelotrichia bacterium]
MLRKLIEWLLGLSLAFTMASSSIIQVHAENSENKDFDSFLISEFVDSVEQMDYLSAFYSVNDPDSFGIDMPKPADGFGPINDPDEAANLQKSLDALHQFSLDSLNDKQQHDYSVYETQLEEEQAMLQYQNFQVLFDSNTGIPQNMIVNLEEFDFRQPKDFDDYLTVIPTIPSYFEEALDFTEKQAADGYFMTDDELESALKAITDFTSKIDDNELIISFNDAVDRFEELTDEQRSAYQEKNAELIKNTLIPAYQEVYNRLSALKGSRSVDGGLSDYDGGAEYMQLLAQQKGSTSSTLSEMISLLEDAIYDAVVRYSSLYQTYGDKLEDLSSPEVTDADDALNYLYTHMTEVPKGPDVNYTVSYLDPTIANPNIIAYYVNPPIDNIEKNVIKVNGDNITDKTDLYTSLSHEGFPGHCYQFTYYYSTDPSPIRSLVLPLGYIEGWAMYAETMALDTSGLDQMTREYQLVIIEMGYMAETLLDLGINGLGWTKQEAKTEMSSIGMNEEYAETYYEMMFNQPCRLTSYGLGMAEMLRLRDKAESTLGTSFDPISYNEVILQNGPRSFELVEQDVDSYIRANGGDPESYKGYGSNTFHGFDDGGTSSSKTPTGKTIDYTGSYVLIGVLIAAGAVAFIMLRKKHAKDPFEQQ